MPLSVAAQGLSHGWTRNATHVALYQSIASDGTPTEVSGSVLGLDGFPIYTRRPIAFTEDTTGSGSTSSLAVRFGVPAGTTIRWWAILDYTGAALCIEPVSSAAISVIPMPCLFRNGLVLNPSAYTTFGAPYVVFWGGPSPSSSLLNAGAYSSLPAQVYARPYWPWIVVGGLLAQSFQIQADAEADPLIPSAGWGWYQRMYPVTYTVDGTYTLYPVHVRTTG
jgi:hypothetical protein